MSREATPNGLLSGTSFAITAETGQREYVSLWGTYSILKILPSNAITLRPLSDRFPKCRLVTERQFLGILCAHREERRGASGGAQSREERLDSEEGRTLYRLRQQSVEPVFGIIKAVLGFTGFSLRGLDKVAGEWALVALAYNCKRLYKLTLATAS